MEKNNLKTRKKNRLDAFHYNDWYFFITVNVQNHEKVFGEVVDDKMILNKYGEIVEKQRLWLNKYENIKLYHYAIMPNHFHWIIEIENVGNLVGNLVVLWGSLQKKWLSSVVWAFKTTSSKLIHKLWLKSFKRQKSFYDHIIRNENDMNRIIEYIELNPYAWENDEYYR